MEGEEITADFFRRDPVTCAKDLIGCIFRWNGCSGRIVETEAYAELDDPACHTWNRKSSRDFLKHHDAGTAYIYLNYGVHWLFNIVAKSEMGNGFVLFRALEPLDSIDLMRKRRGENQRESALCSGPGKLTQALGITGTDHGKAFLQKPESGLFYGKKPVIIEGGRVGISRAIERPWRFGELNSNCLSRKF